MGLWSVCVGSGTNALFDADRKLIAREMDSGFFSKVGAEPKPTKPDETTKAMLRQLIRDDPNLLTELLKEVNGE